LTRNSPLPWGMQHAGSLSPSERQSQLPASPARKHAVHRPPHLGEGERSPVRALVWAQILGKQHVVHDLVEHARATARQLHADVPPLLGALLRVREAGARARSKPSLCCAARVLPGP
jgi:hypothetical protein